MRKYLTVILSFLCLALLAQNKNADYVGYIEKYGGEAQAQMKKHGVPASITLAQGLLESAAGKSELAQKANNHFGIKCGGDWNGATYRHDDETKQECFRKYSKATDSFNDHSLFLKKTRYQSLYELKITDYKGWANGLKKCGYATDPAYPQKLIKLIEDYQLYKFDSNDNQTYASQDDTSSVVPVAQSQSAVRRVSHGSHGKRYTYIQQSKAKSKQPKAGGKQSKAVVPPPVAPVDSLRADTVASDTVASQSEEPFRTKGMPSVNLQGEHIVYRCNGSRYVVAQKGDTFESIAYEFNMYESMLRKYNDIVNPRYQVQEGDKIYLQRKRKYAEKKYAIYRVRRNENIWQIAQDKGMQLKYIYSLNGIEEGWNVTINQELILRK